MTPKEVELPTSLSVCRERLGELPGGMSGKGQAQLTQQPNRPRDSDDNWQYPPEVSALRPGGQANLQAMPAYGSEHESNLKLLELFIT